MKADEYAAVWIGVAIGLLSAATANAQIEIASPGQVYSQGFDTLVASGTAQPWTNNATLPPGVGACSCSPFPARP
jgi:hypothetical protein